MGERKAKPDIAALAQKPLRQKLADGDWYQFGQEPEAQAIVRSSAQTVAKINAVAITDTDQADAMLTQFLPHVAPDAAIYYPITTIEYPQTLYIGEDTFVNANFEVLSAGKVTIGSHCFIGCNCQLYTPNHSIDSMLLRRAGWQYDLPITIGDDCWFGGSVIVCPGVTIGNNVVVGAGSVVTHDLPANCVAAGNPARVIRQTDPQA